MDWKLILGILGFLALIAGIFNWLFGSNVVGRLLGRSDMVGKQKERGIIICGIDEFKIFIPPKMENILKKKFQEDRDPFEFCELPYFYYRVHLKNNSRISCDKPTLSFKFSGDIYDYTVEDTNEDIKGIRDSINMENKRISLKLERLAPKAFVNLNIWALNILDNVNLTSDNNFQLVDNLNGKYGRDLYWQIT